MKALILLSIKLYRLFLSPFLKVFISGGGCRYTPTCSEYAYEAINNHGIVRGFLMSLKRFLKCNPGFQAGFDPVR